MPTPLSQETACATAQPAVEVSDRHHSGWHLLIINGLIAERWYWDADVQAWREHPDMYEAETPRELGCQGYVYVGPER